MSAAHSRQSRGDGAPPILVSSDVRTRNLSIVLRQLAEHGPSARSDLARATGLTRGAITALVGVLDEHRLVRESTSVHGSGSGRPRTLLAVSAERVALVALQIDADQVTVVAQDLAGEILLRSSEHHGRPLGDPAPVLDLAARVLGDALGTLEANGRRVAALPVIVFAPVGGSPRVVLADTDLGWGRVDVLGGLRLRIPHLPAEATLISDATVAALAEQRALGGVRNMIYLKSNSGIGGAIIADGRLVEGANALAGALGHLALDHDGAECECGQRGCLVTVAGPDVVLERAGLGSVLAERGLTEALAELVARVRSGDEASVTTFEAASAWIARAIAVLRMATDPSVVVLGGYWAELAETIEAACALPLHLAVEVADDYVTPPVVAGTGGADAALIGALWQARHELLDDPLLLSS